MVFCTGEHFYLLTAEVGYYERSVNIGRSCCFRLGGTDLTLQIEDDVSDSRQVAHVLPCFLKLHLFAFGVPLSI